MPDAKLIDFGAGLLQGGAGLLGDLDRARQSKDQQKFERAIQLGGLLGNGVRVNQDPDTGDYKLDQVGGSKKDLERQKTELEIKKLSSDIAAGKKLPASEAVDLGSAKAASSAVNDSLNVVNQNQDLKHGLSGLLGQGIVGAQRLLGIGEAGRRAQAQDAALEQHAQVIGKYLEGGKLTDADFPKYKRMLPTAADSPDVASKKAIFLNRLVGERQNAQLESLKGAGFATGNIPTMAIPNIPNMGSSPKGLLQGQGQTAQANQNSITPPDYDKMSDDQLAQYYAAKKAGRH